MSAHAVSLSMLTHAPANAHTRMHEHQLQRTWMMASRFVGAMCSSFSPISARESSSGVRMFCAWRQQQQQQQQACY